MTQDLWHAAGTVNYVKDVWSPTAAEVDCLGSGDEDIDREGRYGLHTPPSHQMQHMLALCLLSTKICLD